MRVSKTLLSTHRTTTLLKRLAWLFSPALHPDDVTLLLKALLSPTEQVALIKRVGIAQALDEGDSYSSIKASLQVSSATIASVQEQLGQPGWKLILEMLETHQKADRAAQRIKRIFHFKS